jgi:hypothetical protein
VQTLFEQRQTIGCFSGDQFLPQSDGKAFVFQVDVGHSRQRTAHAAQPRSARLDTARLQRLMKSFGQMLVAAVLPPEDQHPLDGHRHRQNRTDQQRPHHRPASLEQSVQIEKHPRIVQIGGG